ncbi:MAG: HAD-IA family hydrolase [Anaerolineaceae bacterium]
MKQTINAILFDVGGTLRFTERVDGREIVILEEIRTFLGYEGTVDFLKTRLTRGEKDYRKWAKKSLVELTEQELWVRFMYPDQSRLEFVRENAIKLNQLWRNSKGKKKLLPNAVETIKTLAERGYKLCIISNTTSSVEVPALLEENGITNLFSSVILSAVYGRRKPHPSLFLDATRALGVRPEECAYIGDRPSRDVVGAREAGFSKVVIIQAAGLKHEKKENVPMNPDHLISRLPELLDIFPDHKDLPQVEVKALQPEFLYDAALSTMWNVGQKMPFGETFAVGRQLGFARFELNHAISPAMLEEIDFNHFRAGNVHDPCPAYFSMTELKKKDWLISSLDETNRKKGVDVTLLTIDLAVKLGASSVILHPGQVNGDRSMDKRLRTMYDQGLFGSQEYEDLKNAMVADRKSKVSPHLEAVKKSLLEIIEYAKSVKMSIGLENRYRYYDIPLIDEMGLLLDLCDEPWYGFQYDMGHAQTLSALGLEDHEEWLKRYGKRIVAIHMHDVKGITDHQTPGHGDIDFEMVAKYIPEYAYRTLEVGPQATQQELIDGTELLVTMGIVKKL